MSFSSYILLTRSYKFTAAKYNYNPKLNLVLNNYIFHSLESSVKFLKHFHHFFLNDLTAVDKIGLINRFNLSYLFMNLKGQRVLLNKKVAKNQESVVPYFNSANWLEREVYDMFGVFFEGHPDLRRILTDYGFSSFPFRKDFPVSGYYELTYSLEDKIIKIKELQLQQAARFFL